MKNEIAIIGVGLRVADMEGPSEFWKCLKDGNVCFDDLSPIRKKDIFDRFGQFELSKGSYLDRVDLFDNIFFNIKEEEAVRMDPEQRLMLQCAVGAVYNAGYQIKELKGERIGVFHILKDSYYRMFFDDTTEFDQAGHNSSMLSGRIAYFMDWRGPVMGIAAACSSSLTSVYYACQSISQGECKMALVGGANLIAPIRNHSINPSETTKKEQFIPYNDDPGEPIFGEGVFCMLLKNAEDAIKDRDPIYAIIKGGAINHSGERLQNFLSPNPKALAEVIQMAWKNGKVSSEKVRFIEGLGKGTNIGDAIELNALALAFDGPLNSGVTCSISSVKGQMGEMGTLSGMAGLTRLALALKEKQLLPQWGFQKPNDQMREIRSPVIIQKEAECWESGHPRIGGISSHGLISTNVHLVLKEFDNTISANENVISNCLMKVGGRTLSLATKAERRLIEYVQNHPEVSAARLAYTMNKLVEHDNYCRMICFQQVNQLPLLLSQKSFQFSKHTKKTEHVYLIIPGFLDKSDIDTFLNDITVLSSQYDRLLDVVRAGNNKISQRQLDFLLQYCAIQLLFEAGFSADKIIGIGSGKTLSYLLTGKITLSSALAEVDRLLDESFDQQGFSRFLGGLGNTDPCFFATLGHNDDFLSCFQDWVSKNKKPNIQVTFPAQSTDTFFQIIMDYYNAGNTIDVNKIFKTEIFLQDLDIPIFEPKRFWPRTNRSVHRLQQETEVE
jgi:3-oxoacyl-(acyl-carrier-protein) synthase